MAHSINAPLRQIKSELDAPNPSPRGTGFQPVNSSVRSVGSPCPTTTCGTDSAPRFAIGLQPVIQGSSYGPMVHLRLLSTPPRGDAVTFSFRPESACLKGTCTPLIQYTFRRTRAGRKPAANVGRFST